MNSKKDKLVKSSEKTQKVELVREDLKMMNQKKTNFHQKKQKVELLREDFLKIESKKDNYKIQKQFRIPPLTKAFTLIFFLNFTNSKGIRAVLAKLARTK